MSAETQSESSSISTADHICDLCGCIRSPILNGSLHHRDEVEDITPPIQTILGVCESVNQTLSALQYELAEMVAERDILQQTLSQLKMERATVLRRLAFIENAYESKRMFSEETKGLLERSLTVLEARFDKGKKGSTRSEVQSPRFKV